MSNIRKFGHLRQRVLQLAVGGTASIVAAAIAGNLLRIASSVTLTRLLDARAFGIVGVITSVAIILQLVSDIGVQPFVIRHQRGSDPAFLDEIWTLRLIRSTALTLIMAGLSIPVAAFLGKAEFAPVLAVWSVNFFIDGLSSMSFATAVREQKLWRLTWSELSSSVAQLVVAIAVAVIWRSYWALVTAMLAGAILRAILSYTLFAHSRRRWSLSAERARELWTFSRFIAPSSLMAVIILQADKIVLARMLPLAVFGLYAVAATLAAVGPTLAANYSRRVLYPAYAEIARTQPARLRTIFYSKRRTVTLLYMAAIGAVGGGAPLIVTILYDPRYLPVAPYLELLSISAVLALANNASEELLIAAGKLRVTLYANIGRITWLLLGVGVAIPTGHIMLLIGTFGTVEVVAMLIYWLYLSRLYLFDIREEAMGWLAGCAGGLSGYAAMSIGEAILHRHFHIAFAAVRF